MIAAIVAVDNNWGIGYKNQLLCKIPEDLKRFKQLTDNSVIIMGKNTYHSIGSKPLKNRINIVLTHKVNGVISDKNNTFFMNMDWVIRYLETMKANPGDKDIYIIGGESVYKQLLEYCNKIYITRIINNFKADTFFPNIEKNNSWKCIEESQILQYKNYQYKYITYIKE